MGARPFVRDLVNLPVLVIHCYRLSRKKMGHPSGGSSDEFAKSVIKQYLPR
jgi:hypothetical protein